MQRACRHPVLWSAPVGHANLSRFLATTFDVGQCRLWCRSLAHAACGGEEIAHVRVCLGRLARCSRSGASTCLGVSGVADKCRTKTLPDYSLPVVAAFSWANRPKTRLKPPHQPWVCSCLFMSKWRMKPQRSRCNCDFARAVIENAIRNLESSIPNHIESQCGCCVQLRQSGY